MTQFQIAAEIVGSRIGLDPLPKRLLAQCLAHEDGRGEPLELGEFQGRPVEITLAIDHVVQQESLAISIWGSADQVDWDHRPLVTLPQKHYCGVYASALDLAKHAQIRFLRAEWKLSCWHKGCTAPMFGFTLSVEEPLSRWKRRGGPVRAPGAPGDEGIHDASLGALAESISGTD